MKSQLRDRYLKDNGCGDGIYLVGWFNCDAWDTNDSRRQATPSWTIDAARTFFAEQAKNLSTEEYSLSAEVIWAGMPNAQ